MTEQERTSGDAGRDERARVAQELSGRLQSRGIKVRDDDSADDISAMIEAVERFEDHVRALGGDLMVDVPPVGKEGQPDEPRFRLPLRRADERPAQYASRIAAAVSALDSQRAD